MGLSRNLSKFKPSSDGLVGVEDIDATGTASSTTFLRGDGAWETAGGASGAAGQVFTSSGTFTVPVGVTAVKVTVIGGGGGGGTRTTSAPSSGGGGAGVAIEYITGLTGGATVAVTVGGGGASSTAGGTSSFGDYCSATGGGGATTNSSTLTGGGVGGTASGGDINLSGGAGGAWDTDISGAGGGAGAVVATLTSSKTAIPFNPCTIYYVYGQVAGQIGFLGGAGANSVINTTGTNRTGVAGTGFGNGGGGCFRVSSTQLGGAGSGGIVIVEW